MSWSHPANGDFTAQQDDPEGSTEQHAVAQKAVELLIASGVLGDPDEDEFVVTLSGHSNPGHEPRAGWANDMISISVNQK